VAELQKRLNGKHEPWTVVNAGVRADKTAGGLKRFKVRLLSNLSRRQLVDCIMVSLRADQWREPK
jgi:hypothetical protein